MIRRFTAVALLGLMCLSGSATVRSESGFARRTFDVDGSRREYLVRVPAKAPRAIVVMLNGHGGSAARLVGAQRGAAPYRQWIPIADREGLLLVAPDGVEGSDGRQGWNDCRADATTNPRTDDVKFITALVAALARDHRVATRRVYVLGTSNGGQMALRLAIERPQIVTAAAAIVASMPAHSECGSPRQSVPVLFMNGTRDPILPFAGGAVGDGKQGRGSVLSTAASVAIWARLAGADASATTTRLPDARSDDGSRVVREIHAEKNGTPVVVLDRIEGGGHNEPSGNERYAGFYTKFVGPQNGDIEMADEVWAFFSTQRKP